MRILLVEELWNISFHKNFWFNITEYIIHYQISLHILWFKLIIMLNVFYLILILIWGLETKSLFKKRLNIILNRFLKLLI